MSENDPVQIENPNNWEMFSKPVSKAGEKQLFVSAATELAGSFSGLQAIIELPSSQSLGFTLEPGLTKPQIQAVATLFEIKTKNPSEYWPLVRKLSAMHSFRLTHWHQLDIADALLKRSLTITRELASNYPKNNLPQLPQFQTTLIEKFQSLNVDPQDANQLAYICCAELASRSQRR